MSKFLSGSGKRFRPLLAALIALVVSVSGWMVVPALAGPGSTEVLVDVVDEEGSTSRDREFGGATRYETALAAAERFIRTARSQGTPATTVLIASGESLVDAAAAAGLAQFVNAPVLLTRTNSLYEPAAELIEREGISRVIVLGETEAVSAQVEAALSGLSGVDNVERIGGADRYATAALIAQQMNSTADYCNTDLVSAIVVLGEDGTFADLIVAGPPAYAAGVPILLTTTGGLPADTAAALTSLGVQHVVVVGAAATQNLVSELAGMGIESVTLVAGSNAFDTSVELLNAMPECLGDAFSLHTVALISASALPDGISAAPMLGQGLRRFGDTTPVLLVDTNSLPSPAREFLTDQCRPLWITAIGGTDAIAAQVVEDALNVTNGAPPCDTGPATTTAAPTTAPPPPDPPPPDPPPPDPPPAAVRFPDVCDPARSPSAMPNTEQRPIWEGFTESRQSAALVRWGSNEGLVAFTDEETGGHWTPATLQADATVLERARMDVLELERACETPIAFPNVCEPELAADPTTTTLTLNQRATWNGYTRSQQSATLVQWFIGPPVRGAPTPQQTGGYWTKATLMDDSAAVQQANQRLSQLSGSLCPAGG